MAKGLFKNWKNAKAKRLMFFLVVATIFWVLTKFSREFTSTMHAKIDYENIPETAALAENNKDEITFDLTANGFEILFYKFKKPKIIVPVGKYYSKDERGFKLNKTQLLKIIAANFNRNLAITNLSLDELNVHLDPIVLKKIKVIPRTEIKYKDGFKAIDSFKVVPDSVTISGPLGIIKEIHSIATEVVSLKNVEKNISEAVKIETKNKEIVSIKPNTVKVQLEVAEFSQGKFSLPVEVINLPPDLEIKLVPKSISVSFDVSVNDFTKINKENFRLVCDYSKRNQEENFMVPFFEKSPSNVYNVSLEPKKVDYFIFK